MKNFDIVAMSFWAGFIFPMAIENLFSGDIARGVCGCLIACGALIASFMIGGQR